MSKNNKSCNSSFIRLVQDNFFILTSLFITIFTFIFCNYVFQFQIGGYDLSPLIDLTYRLSNNEIPYHDFINTMPLGMVSFIKILLEFNSCNWNFLFLSSFYHYLVIVVFLNIIYLNSFKTNNKNLFFVLFQLCITIPILTTNHIYHSVFTQLNVSILVLIFSFILIEKRVRLSNYLILFLFFGLVFFSKQNIGFLLCPTLILLSLLMLKEHIKISQKFFLIFTCFSSIIFYYFLSLIIFNFSFSFKEFLNGFLGVSGRALPSIVQLMQVFRYNILNSLILFVVFGMTLKMFYDYRKNKFSILLFFLISVQLISYYSFLTDWDTKMNNISIMLISFLILIFFVKRSLTNIYSINLISIIIGFFFLLSIYLGIKRYRMECVGYGAFYENTTLIKVEKSYLSGLYSTQKFYDIIKNVEQIIIKYDKDEIFFGPRMEWGYAQFELKSPHKFPLWWHGGSSYPINNEKELIDRFKKSEFELLIFLRNDRTRIPTEIINLIDSIDSKYIYKKTIDNIDIYSLKPF